MGVKRIDSGKQNLLRIIKELKKSGKGGSFRRTQKFNYSERITEGYQEN